MNYHYLSENQPVGPFGLLEMHALIERGAVLPATPICTDVNPSWREAKDALELAVAFPKPPLAAREEEGWISISAKLAGAVGVVGVVWSVYCARDAYASTERAECYFHALLFLGALLSGGIGVIFGALRGRPLLGFLLGCTLSVVGFCLTMLVRHHLVSCPHCAGIIAPEASRCGHCGGVVEKKKSVATPVAVRPSAAVAVPRPRNGVGL